MKCINSMAHGLKTSSSDRAAVQQFRSRAATIWGIPDGSAPLCCETRYDENYNTSEDNHEQNLATLAQLNIDILRVEAACDDQCFHMPDNYPITG